MFKHNFFLVWTIASASLTASAAEPRTGSLSDLSIMALGPLDGRAVIKAGDGKMHALKVGDILPGTQVVIEQVLNDKAQREPPR